MPSLHAWELPDSHCRGKKKKTILVKIWFRFLEKRKTYYGVPSCRCTSLTHSSFSFHIVGFLTDWMLFIPDCFLSLPMVTRRVFPVGGLLDHGAAEWSCPYSTQPNRITTPAWRPAWVSSPEGSLTGGCRYLSLLPGRLAPFSHVLLLEICRPPLGFFLGVSAVGPLMGDLLIW